MTTVASPSTFVNTAEGHHWWGILFDNLDNGHHDRRQIYNTLTSKGYVPRPSNANHQQVSKVFFKQFTTTSAEAFATIQEDVRSLRVAGVNLPVPDPIAPQGVAGQPHFVIFKVHNVVNQDPGAGHLFLADVNEEEN